MDVQHFLLAVSLAPAECSSKKKRIARRIVSLAG
jgi:hypothetical protein